MSINRKQLELKARAKKELEKRLYRKRCEEDFSFFVRQAWPSIEPAQPLMWGKAMEMVCDHLEAVDRRDITRLIVNIPPGYSKSTLFGVMFPAWIFAREPTAKILSVAHNLDLALRDSVRCRRLVTSEWYQDLWPNVRLSGDQNAKAKFEIDGYGGFRQALASGSITGVRADHVIVDDPLSATDAMSEAVRNSMKDWILEAVPTRLNNPGGERPSTISVIMQRLHEEDTTGVLLERNLGYEHLMLPQQYDPGRHCVTSIGEDWRTEEGELLFPERFPLEVVERDKAAMGPWASAAQFQQSPSPRGGGLIKRDQFMLYDDALAQEQGKPDASKYPDLDIIIASVDTAYTTKQENDASAITVWGIWQKGGAAARSLISSYADNSNVYDMSGKRISMVDERDTIPCAMLMYAKELFVPLHGDEVPRMEGESPEAHRRRAESKWGLCEHITDICKRFNVDTILIEAKASGISVAQEIKRLNKLASWQVKLVNPGNMDKVARVYSIQPIFSNGQVYCPDKDWSEKVISQCETFPKGRRDDLVDTVSQALRYLRDNGFLARADEVGARIAGEYQIGGGKKKQWIYDV
jgi:predicted phage terminase large subunit-like protein